MTKKFDFWLLFFHSMKNFDTLSSKATVTSKRCIVWKRFIFQNSGFFYLKAYLLRFFHAKFQHFFSTGLASTSFLSVTSFEAFQLFLSDMNGGVSLQTSVTFKHFELECWDWSQIKDFLKEITPGLWKKAYFAVFITFLCSFSLFFMFHQHSM